MSHESGCETMLFTQQHTKRDYTNSHECENTESGCSAQWIWKKQRSVKYKVLIQTVKHEAPPPHPLIPTAIEATSWTVQHGLHTKGKSSQRHRPTTGPHRSEGALLITELTPGCQEGGERPGPRKPHRPKRKRARPNTFRTKRKGELICALYFMVHQQISFQRVNGPRLFPSLVFPDELIDSCSELLWGLRVYFFSCDAAERRLIRGPRVTYQRANGLLGLMNICWAIFKWKSQAHTSRSVTSLFLVKVKDPWWRLHSSRSTRSWASLGLFWVTVPGLNEQD